MTKGKQIIFVDDDPAIQDVVRLMLEAIGYEITVLSTGASLLNDSFSQPDLFILDNQLPGVSGLDICRHLKKQPDTKHIPVLILSASPQIVQQAKEACADGLIEKPFRMQDLRNEVKRLMKGVEEKV